MLEETGKMPNERDMDELISKSAAPLIEPENDPPDS